MQFEPATFADFAVNADHNGKPSPYDPPDAIYTAAAMLCADGASSGTPAGIDRAVFAYNHSDAYVTDVLTWLPGTPSPLSRRSPPRRSRSRSASSASRTSGALTGLTLSTALASSSRPTPSATS